MTITHGMKHKARPPGPGDRVRVVLANNFLNGREGHIWKQYNPDGTNRMIVYSVALDPMPQDDGLVRHPKTGHAHVMVSEDEVEVISRTVFT
jgi:hypothetical protein